jgi:dTDP-4-dehydrorhamnose 3,5-epimerase
MQFHEVGIAGAYLIEPERVVDERGFFARTWCRQEFAERGLDTSVFQSGVAYNRRRGTLRGLHFQVAPYEETKLVRCTRGAIYDVLLDLRSDSATFGRWHAVELTAENRHELHIPRGVAHGYLTLCDDCEIFYQISAAYQPSAAGGVRWDDPAFGIEWPDDPQIISERDASFPLWNNVASMAEATR